MSRLEAIAGGHGDAVVVFWVPAAAAELGLVLTAGRCAAGVLHR